MPAPEAGDSRSGQAVSPRSQFVLSEHQLDGPVGSRSQRRAAVTCVLLAIGGTRGGPACGPAFSSGGAHVAGESCLSIRGAGSAACGDQHALAIHREAVVSGQRPALLPVVPSGTSEASNETTPMTGIAIARPTAEDSANRVLLCCLAQQTPCGTSVIVKLVRRCPPELFWPARLCPSARLLAVPPR